MEEESSTIVKELERTAAGERNEFSQPDKITFKEYLKICCRISYRMRKLKTKGAILVLIWSFMVMNVFYYLLNSLLVSYYDSVTPSVVTIIGVTLPVAGWLADVRFGRYRVMRCSIWTMWISSVLLTTVYVVFSLIEFNHSSLMYKGLTISVVIILAFGLGGFQAIVIQFGIDQLNDASTTEITSFVAWYTWTLVSSNVVSSFINMLTCMYSKYNLQLLGPLIIAMCLTVVVITNYLFSNQLIKEPVTQNPFKLVYKVVRYAIKTKHPRQRSAFTYWEDDPPSRMDFGKVKYGGPFTTEQVEDVKILIKILGVVFVASFLVSLKFNFDLNTTSIILLLGEQGTDNCSDFYRCFGDDFLANVNTIIGLFLVPLNEFLIYPLFYRCILIKIRWKILLGILFELSGLILLIILITYARSKYTELESATLPHNYTLQCLLNVDEKSSSLMNNNIIDYQWSILVEFLFAGSGMMLTIGTIEFFCAQVPYSMKGLVAGCYYGCIGLYIIFNYGLSQAFMAKLQFWELNTTFNCEFWYLLTKIIPVAMAAFMVALTIKYHKKRKREDVLPSEHIFAEQYYSAH